MGSGVARGQNDAYPTSPFALPSLLGGGGFVIGVSTLGYYVWINRDTWPDATLFSGNDGLGLPGFTTGEAPVVSGASGAMRGSGAAPTAGGGAAEDARERTSRLHEKLRGRSNCEQLAARLAIEQALEDRGLMRGIAGGWC
jgi:hypothetical protein